MKSFSNETLNFFLQKVLFLLRFGSCQNDLLKMAVLKERLNKTDMGQVG